MNDGSGTYNPYEFYNGEWGVLVKFLTTDRNHPNSLQLISSSSLRRRMANPRRSERRLRRATTGSPALIAFDSLPKIWKELLIKHFGEPRKVQQQSFFARHFRLDPEANRFYAAYTYGKDQKHLPPHLIEQYTYDASVLNTVLLIKEKRKAYARAMGVTNLDIWQSLSNDVNAFREVPHKLPAHPDALRKKAEKYKRKGYEALISGKLQNRNATKIATREQKALLDELLGKHTNLDAELIASLYNSVARRVGWPEITAQTVINRSKRSALVTYAGRKGVTRLKHEVLMQVKRERPSASMLFWSADGWNVELLYQKTDIDGKGRRLTTYHNRLTMVLVLDPYNNYPVGYALGTHETPALIKRAYRNAMRHVKELFGAYYKPYQLQTDHYAIKKLAPIYKAVSKHFTPAEVKNAKAKPVEPYFSYLNRKYFKLLDNWSGYNVASGSRKQPNAEYLNKIKHRFPDRRGVERQIEKIIEMEREAKREAFVKAFDRSQAVEMKPEEYLFYFGERTGNYHTMRGEGLRIRLNGREYYYDSFDRRLRELSLGGLRWDVIYDPADMHEALAVSEDERYRIRITLKPNVSMTLADRKEGEGKMLAQINAFNRDMVKHIIEQRAENAEVLQSFFGTHQLDDTLAKLLLTDSTGNHKRHKPVLPPVDNTDEERRNLADEELRYLQEKIDLDSYLKDNP